MTANPDDRHDQYVQRRVDTTRDDYNNDDKKNTNDIANRRHSLAHINFRKAIYRSLSLPQANDESNNLRIRCIEYFMKFVFVCLFIVLIGSLIKLMWSFHHRK